jgi:hypothetical protein
MSIDLELQEEILKLGGSTIQGAVFVSLEQGFRLYKNDEPSGWWNPLTTNKDAFSLMCAMRLRIKIDSTTTTVVGDKNSACLGSPHVTWVEPHNADCEAATRFAITYVAACMVN